MTRLWIVGVLAVVAAACGAGTPAGPDAGETPDAGSCPAFQGPTEHPATDVTADATWTAEDSPHVVTGRIRIHSGATLTIAPCAEVRLAPDISITAGSTGAGASAGTLRAVGTAARPILFTREEDAAWGSLWANPLGRLELAHATLEGGGDASRGGASLVGEGDGTGLKKVVKVDTVTVVDSAGLGFNLTGLGGFTDDSAGLTVRGSGAEGGADKAAGMTTALGAGTLPVGDYTGNGADEIVIPTGVDNHVLESVTWPDVGVPFHVTGIPQTVVLVAPEAAGAAVTLTIEPGVVVKFDPLTGLTLGVGAGGVTQRAGVLDARGTAAAPIVFTSAKAQPLAGDWIGLTFRSMVPDSHALEHVRVEYAGGECLCSLATCVPGSAGHEGSISLQAERPGSAFIQNTTIAHSAEHGIVRAWNSDLAGPDFLSSNTFTEVAGCRQTLNKDDSNACPAQIPCD